MYYAKIFAFIHHKQLRDLVFTQEVQGLYRQLIRGNGFGAFCHDIFSPNCIYLDAFIQHSTKITIGNNAQ